MLAGWKIYISKTTLNYWPIRTPNRPLKRLWDATVRMKQIIYWP